jgi:hypothetical protein
VDALLLDGSQLSFLPRASRHDSALCKVAELPKSQLDTRPGDRASKLKKAGTSLHGYTASTEW